MAIERERKFLVKKDSWRAAADKGIDYFQAYISSGDLTTVRIRVAGEKAFITIKGKVFDNDITARREYEYEIPLEEAKEMQRDLCSKGSVKKIRYRIPYGGNIWEVDEFLEDNAELVMAEVEYEHKNQKILLPDWIGEEVTEDCRYTNSSLAKKPYCKWPDL